MQMDDTGWSDGQVSQYFSKATFIMATFCLRILTGIVIYTICFDIAIMQLSCLIDIATLVTMSIFFGDPDCTPRDKVSVLCTKVRDLLTYPSYWDLQTHPPSDECVIQCSFIREELSSGHINHISSHILTGDKIHSFTPPSSAEL